MLHSNRQTFPTFRKGNDIDRSSEFPGRPGSQHRPKLKSQLVSQTIDARSDGDKEVSLLPLVWVEVRDNIIPPHAVPFASDSHGPLFIARAYLEGTFFLGKAGPQLTSGAIISYGSLDITVTRYDVLVCAGQLSWEISHSSGTGFMRQDTVVTKYNINYDLKPALMYHQDIPENTYNLAGSYNRADNNQRSATHDSNSDPPAVVASYTRTRPIARNNSRYGPSSNESLDVNIWKAHDTLVPLKSPLELTERSRSLPPRARTSSFDARAELGTFRCDIAQTVGVTTIASATHRPEYAPASHPSMVASSKPQIHLDCASQESYRLPTMVSAVEYSASERGTPVGLFSRSEITGLREVANVDDWSKYSSPPPEPPAQSVHAGSVHDVLPLRRYPNTSITASTSVNHHTNQLSSNSATSHSLASKVTDSRSTKPSNPSPKDNSQFAPAHYSPSSHKMSSDSSLPQPSAVLSRGVRAGTPGSPVLCLCTPDDVKYTNNSQSKLVNCPVHPATDTIGISASLDDFGHVDQYDQRTRPVAQAHVLQHGAQHQKYQSKDSPSHVPQSPKFPSTDSPPAQSSLVGDHMDVDLRSTQCSRHGVPESLTETSSEDGNTAASKHMSDCDSEHVCDSEHWQLVSRTTLGIEAQTCDDAECDTVASELPAPITINPLNAGIATGEVKLPPHPVPHTISVSQLTGDSGQGHSHVAVQESALERELIQEHRVADTAVSQTTSTGELTSVVPCHETVVAEDCVPLLTVICTPSSPPLRRESTQTISCSDSSATDDKIYGHRECADSSVLVCASVALEENDNSTPTRSSVIAVEDTQKSSPVSHDLQTPSLNKSTPMTAKSLPPTADRHEEPYGQDVVRDKHSEISSTLKLESGEEDVSVDRKRQTVEGRDDHHEEGTESEVKSNLTSYSHTIKIVEGHSSKSTILNNDRRVNEGVDGTVLSPSSINPGSKVSPSEPNVPQDSETSHIESGYEHRSSDVDTVSKSSIQISSHDSTESNEGHIQKQSREEVDSSVLVPVSLAPAETIGAPAPAPCRAVENTQESSPASNDLSNSSLPENMMGQTSSSVTDLKGESSGHIVGTDLPTQGFSTPNDCVEHDKVPVSADCMQEDLECRGDYHAQEAGNEVTLKSESYSSATVSKASGQSDLDTDSDISSLPSTCTGRQLSLSEPGVPQDAGINHIQSACEHQSSDINVASTTLVQTSSHCSIENRVQSSLVTVQGGPCGQDVATDHPCQRFSAPKLDNNEQAECTHQTVENGGGRHDMETESEFQLNSTTHSHSVEIVERSTSETVVLKVDRKMDEDIDVPALPSSPMTTLPPSDPGISQGAGAHLIQPRCEHRSSEVDTTSIALMQTSSHDRSIESEGCQRAQSFSCCDEPETTLSAQVCLPLARSDSDSPPSIDENRVAIPAVSQTTSMGELTSAVPCRETLVAEECVPLSTVTCTPSSPPLGRQSSQTISCNDSPATDDKLHRECAESSVLVCASVALEENDKSTPTRSNVIAIENIQESSPVSHDVRNSSSNESTLTIAESLPLTADRHEEPYSQDVSGYRPSEVSSTPKLEGGEEDVSIDHKRQTVEGREDHQEKGTESEVKSNITPCSHTVRIVEGYTSKCVILNDDRQMNEGVDGTILSPSSINPGSKISPSELDVPRDSGANHIESRYEHWSSDVDTVSKSSVQISGHDSTESSEGHIHRQSREEVDSSVLVRVSLAPAEAIGTPAPAPCRAVENTQKSSLVSNDPNNSSLPEGTWMMGQTSSSVTDLKGESCGHIVGTDLPTQGSSTLNDCVEHDKVPVSADCMQEDLECRGDYHAREAENEVTLKSESYSSAIESLRKSESATVLKASGRSDVDTDSDISSLSSTYTGRQLSLSEPGVPQDAGISHIQSAREHQSSDINITSTTLVQTSSQRSIENRVRGSLVTVQGEPCGQDVATGQPCQRFSAPKLDSNELAECTYQTVENGGGRHELETESEFKLSSTAHFHSVEIVERSTSETVVLKVDRKADEDIDVPALPSSPMTTLPPSDLGISQGAGAHLIQSRCEHQSSEVDTASIALVQTSSCDCSTECKGTQRAQSFSCCDEPKATLSGHVCLSLARSDSDSPPSMDKAVENVQESSPVSNRIWKSSFTMTTGQSHSPVANIHKAPCDQDMTKDQPNRGSCSSEHEADEEGVTADHMYQAVMVLRCECQSSEVNEVSKTSESEHTWSRHSSESGEWHTERQGRQQVHSSGIVILQVGESNATPSQFSDIGVKNAQTSSPTPDDLRNSPMPEGTSTIGQTSPAGDCLQGAPDHDVMGNRYNSRSSSIRKFEDHKVDVTVGCVHQASVTRGDYHEREMESEVEQNLAYHSCSVEMLGQSTSDAVTRNDDRRIDKDADDTALPLSSTTVRPGLSISEPDIPQDAATSSSVITVLTTSMQTSSHSSTVSSEHVRQQPAQTPPCSNELPVDYKVNQSQTTAPVHPFMGRGENNPTSAQPFCVASENTQQPSPASNNIRSSSLPEGASTTGQGSSTPRLKDDKEVISADSTCQVMEDTSYYRSDTTDGREKESRVDAKVAMLTSSSPNPGPKGSHSEPSVPQDAATNHVQSEREHHITE